MVINTNISAANAARLLNDSSEKLSKSLSRLSSGSRLTSPDDDAGGLAVSIRFDAQINRVKAASSNISNAVALSQTQDGFLGKVQTALDRMSELSVLAQDVTKTKSDRDKYDTEFKELTSYVANIGSKSFNGVSLFDGAAGNRSVTIDSDNDSNASTGGTTGGQQWNMSNIDMGQAVYKNLVGDVSTASTISISDTTGDSARTALDLVKSAIDQLATDRSQVGANISRLNNTNGQLAVTKDNLTAANSRIKDVNVADESTEFARYNILVQAGTAMLAQANATSQSALKLLG